MTPLKYFEAVRGILTHLETSQLDRVEQAANIVVESMKNGGSIFLSGIGHGNEQDFLNRAGGLAVLQAFSFNFHLNNPVAECNANRPRPEPVEVDLETARFAVCAGNLRSGDVLVLGSVSGKNRGPIELAMACRDAGVKVIGITSLEYTSHVESLHPSGKKLCDVVDVVIDNGAPYGDGAVDIPGFDFKLLPVSGISAIVAGWMIWGRVMEIMAEAGDPPSVFMSVNRDGGQAYYDKSRAEFNKRGY